MPYDVSLREFLASKIGPALKWSKFMCVLHGGPACKKSKSLAGSREPTWLW